VAFKGVGNATVRTSPVHENKRPRSGTASPEKPTVQALPSKYDMEVSPIEQYSGLDLASVNAVPLRVLVTGFGSFPGTRDNPTALLVHALGGHRARLARLGVELETDVLPVNYAGVARKLEELDETLKPDAILHFGLAARRKFFSIETRALNRLSLVHCDASGARAGRLAIIPGAPHVAKSTFPYRQIEAAFRREGLRGRLSANAGDYVCNETLYLSLARSHARAGFVHVPELARANRPKKASRGKRPSRGDVIRAVTISRKIAMQCPHTTIL
jgi:pyroglutamyl-peptidase